MTNTKEPTQKTKIPFEWELISSEYKTYRAKVIGGWIVSDMCPLRDGQTLSNVFILDPNHEWEIE